MALQSQLRIPYLTQEWLHATPTTSDITTLIIFSSSFGKTFISSGPMLYLTVDGKSIGDTIRTDRDSLIEVTARAESIFPIHTLLVIYAGRVVASTESVEGAYCLEIKERLKVSPNTWLATRCGGPGYYGSSLKQFDGLQPRIFAHTSPVYVAPKHGQWQMFGESTARYTLTIIYSGLSYVREGLRHQPHGSISPHHGEEDPASDLERPFLQAREVIYRKASGAGIHM